MHIRTVNKIIIIICTLEFPACFPYTKLSRTKAKDKILITEALRKSSKTKAKLNKKWLTTKNLQDEANYKSYRKVFRKVAAEAENMYYKSMFNYKTKSVKFSKTVME